MVLATQGLTPGVDGYSAVQKVITPGWRRGDDQVLFLHKGPARAAALCADLLLLSAVEQHVLYIFVAGATEAMVNESPFTSPLIFTC
jgi:hypothetical protein